MSKTPRPADSVDSYLKDISSSTPLSWEREVELSARIQKGDREARDELVRANLRFVIDVAKHYQHRGLPLPDLISAGNLGLLTAAERFDGTKGYKFISYAVWWIRRSILKTLAEQTHTVRLPVNKVGFLWELSKVSERLRQEGEGEPEAEELSDALDVPVQEIWDTLRSARAVRSLDETVDEDEKRSLLDILPDREQESPDAEAVRASDCALLEHVLSSLDERERYVLRLYFGLEGTERMTLEQIGQRMGVTRERARQIKEKALKKLSHPSCARTLQALGDET